MFNPMNLTGKKIIVTGASSGIGRETSILLSKLNAQIVLIGRRKDELEKTLSLMNGQNHLVFAFDLLDFDNYKSLFDEICSDGKKLDGLVHCAGIAKTIPIKVLSNDLMLETMKINYFSFLELTKYYSKKKYSNGGSIVGISAINMHMPQKCMSLYAGSKGALEASIKTLALELYENNIRINSVVPGAINTEMARSYASAVSNEQANKILEGQLMPMGNPEDVANVIAFLLSDASKFVTGRHYYVDGGRL
jgi:NAD(P)-dependent dehydrogenase (short-subunit alcohol dehydrogenase family)